jgi:uncharacterized protein YqeY
MNLQERLAEDLMAALRSGDADRKRTLRVVRASIQYAAIEARGELDDEAVLAVLRREARQRREAIVEFERAGRDDLVASERAELAVIEEYLPPQMDRDEIEREARQAIAELGASGPGDIGRVMGALMGRLSGRADGKVVSEVVRQILAG